MFRYSLFGLILDSEFDIPDLPAAQGVPDVTVRRSTVPWSEYTATPDREYVLHPEAGAFQITGGKEILVDTPDGVPPEATHSLLIGRVMAILLRQRGWLPLHASAVRIGNRAVLFSGPSGAGKSTLAAALHLQGHAVLTDDVAPVRMEGPNCLLQPCLPQLRLGADSRGLLADRQTHNRFELDKFRFILPNPAEVDIIKVTRIYLVEEASEVQIRALPNAAAAAALFRHSFLKRLRSSKDLLQAQLNFASLVARTGVTRILSRPLLATALAEVSRTVEADVGDSTSSGTVSI